VSRVALKIAGGLAALAAFAGVATAQSGETLRQARAGQGPDTLVSLRQTAKPKKPPAKSALRAVSYPGPLGKMAGYLTKDPADGKKHPAIIWISGGDTALGNFWSPQPRDSDQSAAAFREAGVVVFYPAVRGLNGNPGQIEAFYGELDDLVAATQWLKQQPWVDPDRIYLGGHSSGGTMVLLAAEYANEWKAVFAFGAVHDPRGYGDRMWGARIYDPHNTAASRLRSPIEWLSSITMPTLVIEGERQGNVGSLDLLRAINRNPHVHFALGRGCSHFSILRPASDKIAEAIATDSVTAMLAGEGFKVSCD
jgi:dipeptidyl aminopeptidase/acylaminoacyl peptidase